MAIQMLRSYDIDVYAYGLRSGEVSDVTIHTNWPEKNEFHTITLYMNPQRQIPFYNHILQLKPERVIFNPGTENQDLYHLLDNNGIAYLEACTLVMLRTGQF
jgi:hypothetical protein